MAFQSKQAELDFGQRKPNRASKQSIYYSKFWGAKAGMGFRYVSCKWRQSDIFSMSAVFACCGLTLRRGVNKKLKTWDKVLYPKGRGPDSSPSFCSEFLVVIIEVKNYLKQNVQKAISGWFQLFKKMVLTREGSQSPQLGLIFSHPWGLIYQTSGVTKKQLFILNYFLCYYLCNINMAQGDKMAQILINPETSRENNKKNVQGK